MTDSTVDLLQVRASIDALDVQIVALLAKRQTWVEQAGRLKRDQDQGAVRAPARVEAVVEKVRALAATAGGSPEVAEATYRAMIAAFISLELHVHAAGEGIDQPRQIEDGGSPGVR